MAKQVLMVEGPDDEHVVKHICGARGLGKIQEIKPYGGIEPLVEGISVRLRESEIEVVGIVVDADADLEARWQAVVHRLTKAGYEDVPTVPPHDGLVLEAPVGKLLPRVGVWLMPNNKAKGIMEDFLAFLVPSGDELFCYVRRCLEELDPKLRRFSEVKVPKALIHSWLAYQDEPGRPLGQAVSARYLDASLPTADVFAGWLTRLFFSGRT